jgi:hypothetical protein
MQEQAVFHSHQTRKAKKVTMARKVKNKIAQQLQRCNVTEVPPPHSQIEGMQGLAALLVARDL